MYLSGMGNELSCHKYTFLSLLNRMTMNDVSKCTPEMFCFQFVLFLFLLCRIWLLRFSLKITAVFFSFFAVLPNSFGCSDFRDISRQLFGTVNKWESEIVSLFGTRASSVFIHLEYTSGASSPVIPQRLLRVGLHSSFSPHVEHSP